MRLRPYRLALLAFACALALGLRSEGQDADSLGEGDFSFRAVAGYGEAGYALPVANSALGREWAMNSGFAWQLAYGQSILPVRVDIEHRMPSAFRGRIEVESEYAYSPQEKGFPAHGTYSREILVPPSAKRSFYFPVRACPPSAPGELVTATVRLFSGGNQTPLLETVAEATQLEPAHVYTLYLDGPAGQVAEDELNAGNYLHLVFPEQSQPSLPLGGFGASSFTNYTIACDRELLTSMPSATSDFAFVCADLHAVTRWPATEQQALFAYVLGGGYLCLFGAETPWMGHGPPGVTGAQFCKRYQPGRGELLLCRGGLEDARQQMKAYLEGELTEFVLWQGGSCSGQRLDLDLAFALGRRAKLASVYGADAKTSSLVVSHEPGYLNPILAYRELCRQAALVPFDYPEFSLLASGSGTQARIASANRNLAPLDSKRGQLPPELLSTLSLAPLPIPLLACTGLLTLLLTISLERAPRGHTAKFKLAQAARLGLLALGIASAWAVLLAARPVAAQQMKLGLVDRSLTESVEARTELHLRSAAKPGGLDLDLPPRAVLRRFLGDPPQNWAWQAGLDSSRAARLRGPANHFISASLTDWGAAAGVLKGSSAAPAVEVTLRRLSAQRLQLTINNSALAADTGCWLASPNGLEYFARSPEPVLVELWAPDTGSLPGLKRLNQMRQALDAPAGQRRMLEALLSDRGEAVQRILAERPEACGARSALERLALGAALQLPCGIRGCLFQSPAIYYLDPTQISDNECRLVRLSLEMGVAD